MKRSLLLAAAASAAAAVAATASVLVQPASTRASAQVATSSTCSSPSFVTSQPFGGHTFGGYYVYNNEWNASGYKVTQTLSACGYNSWDVVATMNNKAGDGAVKTYPNVQRNFSAVPISSLSTLTSTFAEIDPGVGIYEFAYDIWLNGLATSHSTEVMIWNATHRQVPGGSEVGTVTLDGRDYTVWRSGGYVAFVATSAFRSGTIDFLPFFDYMASKGWIKTSAALDQICYGPELVSTAGAPATFQVTDFSVSSS